MAQYRLLFFCICILICLNYSKPAFSEAIEQGKALGYFYSISQQNDEQQWVIEYQDTRYKLIENKENQSHLEAYRMLIQSMEQKIPAMITQAISVALFIIALVIICLCKPTLLKHPIVIVTSFTIVFILYSLFINLEALRESNDNVRYYYLILKQT